LGPGDVITTAGGGAATRASGEQILRGMVPIFGFDLPARTAADDFTAISKTMALTDNSFPAAMEGTARVYKLNIVYSDNNASGEVSQWRIYNITDGKAETEFTVPAAMTGDLKENTSYITNVLPAAMVKSGAWKLNL